MFKNRFLILLLFLLSLAFNPVWADSHTDSSDDDNTEQTDDSNDDSDDDSSDDNSNSEGLTGCEVLVDLEKGTMEMPCVLVNGVQYQVKMSTQRGNSMNWRVVFLALEDDSVIYDDPESTSDDSKEDEPEDDSSNDVGESESEGEEEKDEEDDDDEDDKEECVPANANANNCKDKEK